MRKVLVIDDEKATLKMFKLFLKAYGYTEYLADNGSSGIEIYNKEKPDIVFTDIKMPGMDGFEVLKKIKKIDPTTEIIVMTGHGDMDLAVQALNLEATDFINKPIQRTALDSALARAEERLKQAGNQESQISLRTSDNVSVIEMRGNITSASEKILIEVYEQSSTQKTSSILLRFDEASSINGAGIAILIQLLSESKKRNLSVAITGISENFKHIFDMVGITRYAKIFDTEEEAIRTCLKNID